MDAEGERGKVLPLSNNPVVDESNDLRLCCFLSEEQLTQFTNVAREDLNAIRKRKLEERDTKFRWIYSWCLGTVHILRNQFFQPPPPSVINRNQCSNPLLTKYYVITSSTLLPSDPIIKDINLSCTMINDWKYHVEIFFSSKTLFICIFLVIYRNSYLII